jgi:hypothetical protein
VRAQLFGNRVLQRVLLHARGAGAPDVHADADGLWDTWRLRRVL